MKSFITKISTLLLLITSATAANAQTKFGDNKATINGSSLLELESTNKGLLMPRISLTNTTTWGLATATPVNGMVVYNTNASMAGTAAAPALSGVVGMYYWDGAKWVGMSGQQKGQTDSLYWALNGNAGTTPPTTVGTAAGTNNFWGTTDAKNLALGTNGTTRAIFDQNANAFGGNGSAVSGASLLGLGGNFSWGINDTTVNGDASAVFGFNNKSGGDVNLIGGAHNKITNTGNLVGGVGNISSGGSNLVSGDNHNITGSSNAVSGLGNKVASDISVVGGYHDTLTQTATYSAVFGKSNKDSAGYTIMAGGNNTLTSAALYTAIFGAANTGNGSSSLIAGALNRDSAGYSIITGDNNTLAPTSAESNLFGTQNHVYNSAQTANASSLITIMGAANILTFDPTAYNPYGVSHATAILGQSNRVTNTPNSLITGFNDTAFASSTVVMGGQNNKVYGAASPAVFGGSNKDSAGYTLVAGFNNIIGTTGTYGAAIGQNNKVAHANSFALGTNATTTKANQLVANFTGGVVLAQLPVYATDAAADADATLPGGSLYKLTGSRAVFQKP